MKRAEAAEQAALIQWARSHPANHELQWLFHIPNGGSRNRIEAANLKRQGVLAGVPDLFLPEPCGPYHGLWIEMKAGKNKLTEKQKAFMDSRALKGYKTAVCYSMDEAVSVIEAYLSLGDPDTYAKTER